MEHLKTRLLDEVYVESRILDDGHLLEVAIELVPGLLAKDLAKDLCEAFQLVGVVGESELAGQLVALDLIVHGHQGWLAAVEQNGCFDVSRMTRL